MPVESRNEFEDEGWVLKKVVSEEILLAFDCGEDDLNEYFRIDALAHKEELLTQTYCVQEATAELDFPVALLDLCNDAVRLEKCKSFLNLSDRKQHNYIPAVKLTRLGVAKELQGLNIGSHTLNMLKKLFLTDNRTGCRFITVDAYNNPKVIKFYEKNGFAPFGDKDKNKTLRNLFFDLKRLRDNL